MKSFTEFIEESNLLEASLGHMLQHLKGDKPFAIVTASRAPVKGETKEETAERNNKNNEALRTFVSRARFGFFKIKGSYPEIHDGKKIQVEDDSTCIIGSKETEERLLHLTKELMKKYNQDSIIFKTSEGSVKLIYKDDSEDELGNEFHPNKIGEYMSKIKGKSFVLGSISEHFYEDDQNSIHSRGRTLFCNKLDRKETF